MTGKEKIERYTAALIDHGCVEIEKRRGWDGHRLDRFFAITIGQGLPWYVVTYRGGLHHWLGPDAWRPWSKVGADALLAEGEAALEKAGQP